MSLSSDMKRRDFLRCASLATLSGSAWSEIARGQETKFVVADTTFGKVRGIDNQGIKTFKGIPYGAGASGV
ncbi:MAG: carboxylesterase/lipase family protein, partial [Acidobacteriia bacterium]|nr:carboxylesterase/lipase family protein [Terriglobia bacterium]